MANSSRTEEGQQWLRELEALPDLVEEYLAGFACLIDRVITVHEYEFAGGGETTFVSTPRSRRAFATSGRERSQRGASLPNKHADRLRELYALPRLKMESPMMTRWR